MLYVWERKKVGLPLWMLVTLRPSPIHRLTASGEWSAPRKLMLILSLHLIFNCSPSASVHQGTSFGMSTRSASNSDGSSSPSNVRFVYTFPFCDCRYRTSPESREIGYIMKGSEISEIARPSLWTICRGRSTWSFSRRGVRRSRVCCQDLG